jgi:hypothetical protein
MLLGRFGVESEICIYQTPQLVLILKDCMIDALIDYNKKSKHQLSKIIFCTDGPLLNREDVSLLLISATQEQTLC